MLIALMADIHANREALEASLGDAGARNANRYIFLGDHINYGADPEWVVATLMEYVASGSVALLGNHDAALREPRASMDVPAQAAMEWTRIQLGVTHRNFLSKLPLTHEEGESLFVHADASAPRKWKYVLDPIDAARSLKATRHRLTFCGHVHRPATYNMSWSGQITRFRPVTGMPVPLLRQRQWIAVLGSVGQPRDGNPAACYTMFDTDKGEITYFRVPYDIETAAAKIRKAGLPSMLAERLKWGH